MELRHDWKSLNQILFLDQSQQLNSATQKNLKNALIIQEGDKIVDAVVSHGKKITKDSLSKVSSVAFNEEFGVQNSRVVNRKDLNQWIRNTVLGSQNYYQQLQSLRERIHDDQKTSVVISKNHFIIDLFSTQLARFLPKKFNVCIFIDQRFSLSHNMFEFTDANGIECHYRALVLSFDNQKLDQFYEPDFSSLHNERLRDWVRDHDLVGSYLENRYMLPCFSIFVYKDVWEKMNQAAATQIALGTNPWRTFVRFLDDGRAALTPRNFILRAYLMVQRVLVYLGKN